MNMTGGSPENHRRPPGGGSREGGGGRNAVPRVRADVLFGGMKELIIEHGTDEYRLRLTSNGKLILTK